MDIVDQCGLLGYHDVDILGTYTMSCMVDFLANNDMGNNLFKLFLTIFMSFYG